MISAGQERLGGLKIKVVLNIQAPGDEIKHKEIWEVPYINSMNGKLGKKARLRSQSSGLRKFVVW
jgi:hypothetical protein